MVIEVQGQNITDKTSRQNVYRQNVYGTKRLQGQKVYGTKRLQGQEVYRDKTSTGQKVYWEKTSTGQKRSTGKNV